MEGLVPAGCGACCGLLAGFAAQYGRLCTVGAIEDAVVAGDFRRSGAWAIAAALTIVLTQGLVLSGALDLGSSHYVQARLDLIALVAGGLLFGLGAAMVGTCAFGLLVRLGTGDLRALMCAVIVGLTAFATLDGVLSPIRIAMSETGVVDLSGLGGGTLTAIVGANLPDGATWLCVVLVAGALLALALRNRRLYRKPRLLAAACMMGGAVAFGWLATGVLVDPFDAPHPHSLTFVAPLGRAILLVMGETLASTGFAVSSLLGVVAGSCVVAAARRELRWEAFDDPREMRRHLMGAACMGIGGVLARGCTIGQGLSGLSTLSLAAPIAVAAMVLGARLGLAHLIEGRSLLTRWRDPLRRRWPIGSHRGQPSA